MVKEENFLITEYEQICQYFINIGNYRFLLFGFYSASVGLIITSDEMDLIKRLLIFVLTIFIWIMEMRNRSLAKTLKERGIEIESNYINSKKKTLHFFNYLDEKREEMGGRIFGIKFENIPILKEVVVDKKPKYQFFPKKNDLSDAKYVYYLFSFSFAVDIAYFLAIVFSIFDLYLHI